MAGKIKKGFTTYLIVLFIALVAAFMIYVTIMLFSPFKSYLGLQYFVYDKTDYVYNVTNVEDNEVFDFNKIEKININCNYANVVVERSNKIDKHAIIFTNKSKGFAKSTQDTSFNYDLSYQDSSKKVLEIKVSEPTAFLYFSKNITISVLLPTEDEYSFENTAIDITNTTGNIYLGDNIDNKENKKTINVNDLSLKTNSGYILLFNTVDNEFNDLFISSKKGDVEFRENIKVTNEFKLYSTSGELRFANIEASKLIFNLGNSKFKNSNIKGDVELYIQNGYFDVAKIEGDVISNDSYSQMGAASINIKEVEGIVSFPFANASKININSMNSESEFYAESTSGNINIGKTYGEVYIKTTSGDVNVYTLANDIKIETVSGDINVVYDNSNIADQLDFYSQKGEVSLKIKSDLKFRLAIYNSDGKIREDNKINIDWMDGKFTNPLIVNGGTKNIIIYTNNNVNISLLDLA